MRLPFRSDTTNAPADGEELRTYAVSGMTCGHCVSAVSSAVGALDGVAQVVVNLEEGTATVAGRDLDDAEVRAAIAGAGYEVVER